MKLKRLILQGFKSFKDKTTINFEEGITGIVGPNGCGKSNIVDALFWAMGEMSAKHLRGNSMRDVIFAGSSKYSPSSFAEVSLVLDNEELKHIHIAGKVARPAELQLTRKLYRNGESEYRINGQPCRLKDIQEVFMDTGAGAKSYSIIAQGEINKIVQAKPVDRKAMIEEVAGITKFKAKRKESIRKIEQTQGNISRLSDLQVEISKNLKALESQAEKAQRAKTLKEKIERNDLVVHAHKEFELLRDYKESKQKILGLSADIEGWKASLQKIELDLQTERHHRDEKSKVIESIQVDYNEMSKKLAASEERLSFSNRVEEEKQQLVLERTTDNEELNKDLKERLEREKKCVSDLEKLRSESVQGIDFSALEKKREALKNDLTDKRAKSQQLASEASELKESFAQVNADFYKVSNKRQEDTKNLDYINEEMEALEKQFSSVSSSLAKERDECNELHTQCEKLKGSVEKSKQSLESLEKSVGDLESKRTQKKHDLVQLKANIDSLKKINQALEGAKAGNKDFLKSERGKDFLVIGHLIECEEKYSKAVENALCELFEALISRDDGQDGFFEWEQLNPSAGLELVRPNSGENGIIDEDTIARLEVHLQGQVKALSSVVEINDSSMKKRLLKLFSGYYLVSDLTAREALEINSEINFRCLVSEDGRIVARKDDSKVTLSTYGDVANSRGFVERNNEIAALGERVEVLETELREVEQIWPVECEKLEKIKERASLESEQLADLKASYCAKKAFVESKVENCETHQERVELLKKRKKDISDAKLEALEQEEKLKRELGELKTKLELKEVESRDAMQVLDSSEDVYKRENEQFLALKVESESFESRVEALSDQIQDTRGQIEKLQRKIEHNDQAIEELKGQLQKNEAQKVELEAGNKELANKLAQKKSDLSSKKDELEELLAQMKGREDEIKNLSIQVSKAEKEVVKCQGKVEHCIQDEEHIVKDIFEKYQIDLRKVLGEHLEYTKKDYEGLSNIDFIYLIETEQGPVQVSQNSYEFVRRYGQDLKDCHTKLKRYKSELNRLGEINWQAIEDYSKQKVRHDFLKEQEQELKTSLSDLENAIEHIDNKCRVRFKEAFDEVSLRFEKVFPIIFGGGSSRLQIIGPVDSPDCGIDIVARPPGKKMQNINLMSGGEKALTAVSLIFSIFLVKPSPFCLLDEVDAPLDDANVGRFNELLREMCEETQFILITHNKKTMELNDTLYGVTMQEPGISNAVSVHVQ